MAKPTVISLDAMGGDDAPDIVVDGIRLNRVQYPDVRYLLYGDQAILKPMLDADLRQAVEIRHTDQVVGPNDKPSHALRRGKKTSMRLAIDAVVNGEASGVVSAGNTGALMAISKFVLRTLPGIERPAICGFLPTIRGECVMLDLGANVQCDSDNLVQFAIMGADFCRAVLGRERPLVGLLNVGAEELKGSEEVKAAARVLSEEDLFFDYYGFVEGNDIAAGTVDVVVTDGFSGNVALKSHEGAAKLLMHSLKVALESSLTSKLGYLLAKGAFERLRDRMDPNGYNGGVFLGLNGVVVKSHGGANADGFASAIRLAIDMVQDGMIDRIKADFQNLVGETPVTAGEADE